MTKENRLSEVTKKKRLSKKNLFNNHNNQLNFLRLSNEKANSISYALGTNVFGS